MPLNRLRCGSIADRTYWHDFIIAIRRRKLLISCERIFKKFIFLFKNCNISRRNPNKCLLFVRQCDIIASQRYSVP